MKTLTKLVILAITIIMLSGIDAYSQSNRDWWNGLSPEWKEFFMKKYMKQKQLDDGVEMSDSKLQIIVGAKSLNISGNQNLKDLSALSQFKDLEILDMSNTGISDLRGLKNVPNLVELDCSNSELIEDLTPVQNMRRLEKLNCFNTSVANLDPLKYVSLKQLNIGLCFIADNSLEAISGMQSLEKLDISQNELIRNLGFMNKLQNLSELNCSKSPIVSIDSIAALKNLEDLDISGTEIRGLKPLINVKTLLRIDISNTEIKNIDALYASTAIRNIVALNLKIDDPTYVATLKESIKVFNEKRPDCIIEYSVQ